MSDDLQHANASVDWAVSQLPSFSKRLNAWLDDNINVVIKELPPDTPNNVVIAIEKETLPLVFQVEAGVYLNAIRSSLDILSATLANRYCQTLIDEAYFPIASREEIFRSAITAGKGLKGAKFVKALPAKERDIIESLMPYKGGNDLLYALHNLDIVRKHVRLLTVEIMPSRLRIANWQEVSPHFTFVAGPGWMRSGDDETVIGLIAKIAPNPEIKLTMQVGLGETNYLPHREVVTTLYEFANLGCRHLETSTHPACAALPRGKAVVRSVVDAVVLTVVDFGDLLTFQFDRSRSPEDIHDYAQSGRNVNLRDRFRL